MTKCDSCGCDVRGTKDDATCRGCGIVVCQSCTDVFEHVGNGLHGSGNPVEEVERLRTSNRALMIALAFARSVILSREKMVAHLRHHHQ